MSLDLLLTPDTPHEHGTYLLFRDECRCGRHSFWPDLCAYIWWWCLEVTELKAVWRNRIQGMVYWGVFWEQLCTWLRRPLAKRSRYKNQHEEDAMQSYIQCNLRCNAILHSMQPWTLNPKVNPTLSLPLFFFFRLIWFLYTQIACVKSIIMFLKSPHHSILLHPIAASCCPHTKFAKYSPKTSCNCHVCHTTQANAQMSIHDSTM